MEITMLSIEVLPWNLGDGRTPPHRITVPLDFPVKTKLRGTLIIKFIWEAKMNQRGGYPNPEDWLFGGANEYNRYHLSQYIKIFRL
ncbi:hypothetical protein AAMO2058_000164600 [Amorphochlora amoebiformis]